MVGKIFGILLLILLGVVIIWAGISNFYDSKRNKERFNDGKCPNCDTWLEYEGETDLKDRIYKCHNCGHTVRIGMHSNIDFRYCNINDCVVWIRSCQYCKSKQYCMYYKKINN